MPPPIDKVAHCPQTAPRLPTRGKPPPLPHPLLRCSQRKRSQSRNRKRRRRWMSPSRRPSGSKTRVLRRKTRGLLGRAGTLVLPRHYHHPSLPCRWRMRLNVLLGRSPLSSQCCEAGQPYSMLDLPQIDQPEHFSSVAIVER